MIHARLARWLAGLPRVTPDSERPPADGLAGVVLCTRSSAGEPALRARVVSTTEAYAGSKSAVKVVPRLLAALDTSELTDVYAETPLRPHLPDAGPPSP